jgi:hypothetical protein
MEDPGLAATETLASVSPISYSITNTADSIGLPVSANFSDDFQQNYTPDDDDLPHNRGLDVQDNWENTLVYHISFEPQGSEFLLVSIEFSTGPTYNIESSPPLLL